MQQPLPKPDRLNVNFSKKRITGEITIFNFIDNDHHIAYIPSLKLSSYGDTPKDATDSLLDVVLKDFFSTLVEHTHEQGINELHKLGWKKENYFNKHFVAKSFIDKEGVLRNFNLSEETEITEKVVTV